MTTTSARCSQSALDLDPRPLGALRRLDLVLLANQNHERLVAGDVLVLDRAVRGQDQLVAHLDEPGGRAVDAAIAGTGLAFDQLGREAACVVDVALGDGDSMDLGT